MKIRRIAFAVVVASMVVVPVSVFVGSTMVDAADESVGGWIDPSYKGRSCVTASSVAEPVDHRTTRDYVMRCFLNPGDSTHTAFINNLADIDGSYGNVGATVWGTRVTDGGQHGVTCSATQEALTHGPLTGHQGEFIDSGDPELPDNFFQYVFRCDPSYSGSNGASGLSSLQVTMCNSSGGNCRYLHEFADRNGTYVGTGRCAALAPIEIEAWTCTTHAAADLGSWAAMPEQFGEAPPVSPCSELIFGPFEVSNGPSPYETVTMESPAVIWQDGVMRVGLDETDDFAQTTQAVTLSARFTDAEPWREVAQLSSVSVFPRTFTVTRYYDTVSVSSLRIKCEDHEGEEIYYWSGQSPDVVSTGAPVVWTCQTVQASYRYRDDPGDLFTQAGTSLDQTVAGGGEVQISLSFVDAPVNFSARMTYRWRHEGDVIAEGFLADFAGGVSPSYIEPIVDVPTHPLGADWFLSDLEIGCDGSDGSTGFSGALDGGWQFTPNPPHIFETDPGAIFKRPDDEPSIGQCFTATGIGINPSSWLPAGGRMAVCILRRLFQPGEFDEEAFQTRYEETELTVWVQPGESVLTGIADFADYGAGDCEVVYSMPDPIPDIDLDEAGMCGGYVEAMRLASYTLSTVAIGMWAAHRFRSRIMELLTGTRDEYIDYSIHGAGEGVRRAD